MSAGGGPAAISSRSSVSRSSRDESCHWAFVSVHHAHWQEAPSPPPVRACWASSNRSTVAGSIVMVAMLRRYAEHRTPTRAAVPRSRSRRVRGSGRIGELSALRLGHRDVAQLGSALDWGSRGRRFKSCHPDRTGGRKSPEIRGRPVLHSPGGRAILLPSHKALPPKRRCAWNQGWHSPWTAHGHGAGGDRSTGGGGVRRDNLGGEPPEPTERAETPHCEACLMMLSDVNPRGMVLHDRGGEAAIPVTCPLCGHRFYANPREKCPRCLD